MLAWDSEKGLVLCPAPYPMEFGKYPQGGEIMKPLKQRRAEPRCLAGPREAANAHPPPRVAQQRGRGWVDVVGQGV